MRIVHFIRKPFSSQFSIEGYYAALEEEMRKKCKIKKVIMPYLSKGFLRRAVNLLISKLNEENINHVFGDINYVAILLNPHNTVLTVLDCQVLERLRGWRRAIIKYWWFTLPCKRVKIITVISHETKKKLINEIKIPRNKVEVVPICVSSQFKPMPANFNEEKPSILQVGTKENKNVIRVIKALCGIQCRLIIIGKLSRELTAALNEYRIEAVSLIEISNNELVKQYCSADIISFPSTYEGFGMPIIEGQLVGRPVVTSNCSSMPEVAGDGACFVDPFDIESIRNGFQRIIEDFTYRESLISAGYVNCERFKAERISNQFISIYKTLGK